jgi:hypothetical protein
VDKEITYFEVLTSLLKYNRLKLSYEKSQYEEQAGSAGLGLYNDFTSEGDVGRAKGLTAAGGMGEGAGGGAGVVATATGWVPSLQNVINALDNLSFRRVFESLEKLQTTQVKRFADMVSPLGLYKEMMCYLRVLLESSDETHNEFAIARLYSIFYTSSERKDPLPRILAEWSPGMPLKNSGYSTAYPAFVDQLFSHTLHVVRATVHRAVQQEAFEHIGGAGARDLEDSGHCCG